MPRPLHVKFAVIAVSLPLVFARRSGLETSPDFACDYAHPLPDLDCSSPVSNDYYGEGVRIGIYLTWFTSWVANSFVEEEIAGALDANTIFLMAVLISMLKATARSELAYIDGLILMQLSAGYLFGCLSLWGYRTVKYYKEGPAAIRHFGGFGTHARLLLMFGIAVYGIWFWVEGIKDGLIIVTDESGNDRPCQCHPLRTFFFAKLLVLGGIRYLYIVMSTGTAVYFGIMLLVAMVERVLHLAQVRDPARFWHRGKYETGFSQLELKWIYRIIHFSNLIWMVFSILTVEFTLNWNSVVSVTNGSNIATPSQLLPLLIGLTGLVRVTWMAVHGGMLRRYQETQHITVMPSVQLEQEEHANLGPSGSRTSGKYLVAWMPWLSRFPCIRLGTSTAERPGREESEGGKIEHILAVRE